MSSVGRIALLREGKRPDRVPVSLSLSSYAPRMLDLSPEEFYLHPETAFEANCRMEALFPSDSGIGFTVPDSICLDFGGDVDFSGGPFATPQTVRVPAPTKEALEKLEVPDPRTAPGASRELAYARLSRKHGKRGVGMALSSPFRQSVEVIGIGNLLRWMKKAPELVHYTCDLIEAYSMKKAALYIEEFGADALSNAFSYPMESHQLISPADFRRFSAPHALSLHLKLREKGVHVFSEHLCGNHRHNLWFFENREALPAHTLFTVGTEVPLREISEGIGARHILGGNVDTTTLLLGSPGDVYEESKRILQEMKYRDGGFVLAAACVISPAIPPENITAMIRAAEDFGTY